MKIPEGLLQTLLDTEPECVKVIGTDGTILEMNRAGLAMLEADSINQVRGRHLNEFIDPSQRERVQQLTRAALLTGGTVVEFDAIGLKGGRRRLEARLAPLRDAQGDIIALLSVTRDLTERGRLERTVTLEREQYRLLFEQNPVPLWVFDPDTLQFLAVNDAGVRQHGWPRARFLAMKLTDLQPADEVPALLQAIRHAAQDDPTNYGVWRLGTHDGTVRDVELVGSGIRFEGQRARLIAVQDVTLRRSAERELQANRDRILRMQEALLDGARIVAEMSDLDMALQRLTESAARVLDVGRVSVWRRVRGGGAIRCLDLLESHAGRHTAGLELPVAPFPHYFEALDRDAVIAAHDARSDARTSEFTEPYLGPLGIGAMLDVPIRRGTIVDGVLCCEHVGTARRWTDDEQSFAVTMANFVALAIGRFEENRLERRLAAGHGVSTVLGTASSVDTAIPRILDELCHRLGWHVATYWRHDATSNELACAHFYGAGAGAFEEASRFLRFAAGQGLPGRVRAARSTLWVADVSTFPAFARVESAMRSGLRSAVAFPVVHGETVLGVVELWNRTSQPEDPDLVPVLSGIGAQIGQFIVRTRADEALREAHGALQALIDAAPVAIMSLDVHERITMWNPAAERMFGWKAQEVLGRDLPIIPNEHKEQVASLVAEIMAGRTIGPIETRRQRRDGVQLDVTVSAAPLRDGRGRVVGRMGVVVDQSQQRLLEAQLRQAQKMEAVGRLAGGVAHDFNNMLTAILGYTDLVASKMPDADPLRADLDEIRQAGERAARLTRQLLAFSRRQVLQPRILDLNTVISDMTGMLRRLIGEDIALRTSLAADAGAVRADAGQLEQVVMNLAVNSRDAMPKGGSLAIETANVDIDEAYARRHPDVTAGPYVRLTVTDTGCGMTREALAHVFEPFFTTKDQGRGTGLGLSTIYGIVRQSGGHIWVYSEPGRGTTFKIHFPRVARPVEAAPDRAAQPAMPRGTETVLVVEDEASLRALTRHILEAVGYRVLEAGDGEEALRVADRTPVVDLLLTDVVMPRLNGRDMAERMRVTHPSLRVLFMSGYTLNVIAHNGVLDPSVRLIEKPFTPGQLARRVRDVLDAKEPS